STPGSARSGARRTRRSASTAGRRSTPTSPNRAMSFPSCNTSSRSSTSRTSRLFRTSPALFSRRWCRRRRRRRDGDRPRPRPPSPTTGEAHDEAMIALAILRRLLLALVTLAGVAIVVFFLLRVVPGDPIAMMISPGASQADIAALRAHYGLDGSLMSQFAVWVRYALRGDFGTSISLRRDVLALLGERLPATLELATAALEFAVI